RRRRPRCRPSPKPPNGGTFGILGTYKHLSIHPFCPSSVVSGQLFRPPAVSEWTCSASNNEPLPTDHCQLTAPCPQLYNKAGAEKGGISPSTGSFSFSVACSSAFS